MKETASNKDKIFSPTYGVEVTQREQDFIKEVQYHNFKFKSLPCALLFGEWFYFGTRKYARQLGLLRGVTAMILGMFGWFGGKYIGGRELDNKLMTEFPDGNAAKIIRERQRKGDFPVIQGNKDL